MDQNFWRKCIVCKNEIAFRAKYYKCSVSSCDKKRAPAQFCSVSCWDVHRSVMNHKSAGADEYTSPSKEKWAQEQMNSPKVRVVRPQSSQEKITSTSSDMSSDEVLVVVSKLKAFVKEAFDLNTSADVIPVLSDVLRNECQKASQSAHRDGRKTLMARDFR